METRDDRQRQLAYLYQKQDGKCFICGEEAVLDGRGGTGAGKLSAVRFRVGSSFGKPGRRRPKVMAHRKCADERSSQIQDSQSVEERWLRSGREPSEFYSIK